LDMGIKAGKPAGKKTTGNKTAKTKKAAPKKGSRAKDTTPKKEPGPKEKTIKKDMQLKGPAPAKRTAAKKDIPVKKKRGAKKPDTPIKEKAAIKEKGTKEKKDVPPGPLAKAKRLALVLIILGAAMGGGAVALGVLGYVAMGIAILAATTILPVFMILGALVLFSAQKKMSKRE